MTQGNPENRGAAGRLDFASGAVLALLSSVALFWIIPAAVPGGPSRGEVSPSFFPKMAAGVVLICSIAMMAINWRAFKEPSNGKGLELLFELAGWTAIAAATYALLAHLGFVAAGAFATAAGIAVSRYRRNRILLALLVVGLPFALKYGVWTVFTIQLP